MAKAATTKSDSSKSDTGKKKKKAKAAAGAPSVKVKKVKAPKADKSEKKASKARDGFDGLAKLADHPLVADLLAAGAIAAVAAIAEHQMGKTKGQSSSKMVKSVGKAAAAAMGKKLMGDLGAITGAASDAIKKA